MFKNLLAIALVSASLVGCKDECEECKKCDVSTASAGGSTATAGGEQGAGGSTATAGGEQGTGGAGQGGSTATAGGAPGTGGAGGN